MRDNQRTQISRTWKDGVSRMWTHSLNAVECSSVPDVGDKFIVETLGTNIVRHVCEVGYYRALVTEEASSFGMTGVGGNATATNHPRPNHNERHVL